MTHDDYINEWAEKLGLEPSNEQRAKALARLGELVEEFSESIPRGIPRGQWEAMLGGRTMEQQRAEAREWTTDETRERLFEYLWWYIDSLCTDPEETPKTKREALVSFAFRVFSTLEGAGEFCWCDVIPRPHPKNKEHCRGLGENWYPSNGESILRGEDHHDFIAMDPDRERE